MYKIFANINAKVLYKSLRCKLPCRFYYGENLWTLLMNLKRKPQY